MLTLLLVAMSLAAAPAASCNDPLAEPVAFFDLPGSPFAAIPSQDGCTVFVSLTAGSPPGVAVLRRGGGKVSLDRVIKIDHPTGMVFTHDGKTLIVAADSEVVLIDTERLAVTATIKEPPVPAGRVGAIYVNVLADNHTVFVSDEFAQRITVIDLEKRSVVTTIPTGQLPIALTLSPNGRYLYTTSESAAPEWNWPAECKPEGAAAAGGMHPQGAVVVIDVARTAVVAKVPAGCSAVRLALSANGDTAYVTARNADSVMIFDTAKLIADPAHALTGTVPVGIAPVGVALIDGNVVVANSNRFQAGPKDKSTLSVIRGGKVIATIPTGSFPREIAVTADARTLLVTNFASKQLEVIDFARQIR